MLRKGLGPAQGTRQLDTVRPGHTWGSEGLLSLEHGIQDRMCLPEGPGSEKPSASQACRGWGVERGTGGGARHLYMYVF